MNDRAAIFLDRDGVINENRDGHVRSWSDFQFIPGVLDALRDAAPSRYAFVVVTNQSVIGRGLATRAAVDHVHSRMLAAIEAAGGRIDALYLCPHAPDDGCPCRKPRPGMLLEAARELGLTLADSHFIGDALTDVEAARAAGVQPVLVLSGRGRDQLAACDDDDGFRVADTLAQALAHLTALSRPLP